MDFSIIVTTRGRITLLYRLFESLLEQNTMPHEVLLGLQYPSSELNLKCSEYAQYLPIRQFNMPYYGLSKARNILFKYTSCDIITFSDDDCWYLPDTLSAVASAMSDQHKDVVVGRPHWDRACIRSRKFHPLNKYTIFSQAPSWCLFFRREVIEAVGFFDEKMGIGAGTPWQSGEETDYLIRALNKGFTVTRDESIGICHNSCLASNYLASKTLYYAYGRMHLLRKHRFPLWFKLLTVAYPLLKMLTELHCCGWHAVRNRWTMFRGRLEGLLFRQLKRPQPFE